MKKIYNRVLDYLRETKELNQAYYRQNESVEMPENKTSKAETLPKNVKPVKESEKIAILINSRITKENVSKETWKHMNKIIEEKMTYYRFLPYQICDCSYIGEGVAWAQYNLNNKRELQLAIYQINYFLAESKSLDEMIAKVIPTDFHIAFETICFDGPYCYGLPRSYVLYQPETKNGKKSQYPLIAFFNTAKGTENYTDEFYSGELYYAINGDFAKAVVHCHKHGKFAEFTFSVIGRTFLISKIRTIGKDGKQFVLYDCIWALTDYIDFA